MINMNYNHYTGMARILADQIGLSLNFNDEGKAYATARSISVPRPSIAWTNAQFDEWMYMIYHEIGHRKPIGRKSLDVYEKNKAPMGSFMHDAFNLVDDTTQEQISINEGYRGQTTTILTGGYNWKAKDVDKLATLEYPDPEQQKMQDAFSSLWVWDMGLRSSAYGLDHVRTRARDSLNKQAREWFDQIEAGDYTQEYRNIEFKEDGKGWFKLWDLLLRINREVWKLDEKSIGADPEFNKKVEQGGGEEEEGTGKEGKEKEKGEGKEGEKGEEKRSAKKKINFDEYLMHKHDKHGAGVSYHPLEIEYEDKHLKEAETYIPTEVEILTDREGVIGYYRSAFERCPSHNLATQMRKLLMAKAQVQRVHGKKQGKISARNVYRATIKNSGDLQNRIFKKKIPNNTLNAAAYILGDGSGSMGGEKIIHMGHAMMLLNDALGSLHVPFEMTVFTHDGNPQHTIIKEFNKPASEEHIINQLTIASNNMGNNADGESIMWAYQRLLKRKEPKKILIVLSDGQPAADQYSVAAYTKEVIRTIEKGGIVDIYGIGILTRSVERFYNQRTVINNASELEHKLLEVIKTKLINE